ncbi:MAG: hypothetical protein ABSH35_31985, partial [Isosphaeraceae bacterium]
SQVLLPYPFDRCCVLHAPTIITNSNSYKTNLLNLFFRGSLAPPGEGSQVVVVSFFPTPDKFLGRLDNFLNLRVSGIHEGEQLLKFDEALVVDLIPTVKSLFYLLFVLRGHAVVDLDSFAHCFSSLFRPPWRSHPSNPQAVLRC